MRPTGHLLARVLFAFVSLGTVLAAEPPGPPHAAPARLLALIEGPGTRVLASVAVPMELPADAFEVRWTVDGSQTSVRGSKALLALESGGRHEIVWSRSFGELIERGEPLVLELRPAGGALPSSTLVGKDWMLSLTPRPPQAAQPEFVQLYIGTKPLSPKPAPLSTAGTAVLTSVTLAAATTSGTVLTLEKVLENGQFFFPHEVIRRYTIQISATASQQLILGDPGVVFVNPAILGTPVDALALLGNRVPTLASEETRRTGCAMSKGAGTLGVPLLLLLPALPLLFTRRRNSNPQTGDERVERKTDRS